jgi:hypothetical protein
MTATLRLWNLGKQVRCSAGVPKFWTYGSVVLCMRPKAWPAARVSLQLARLPRTARSAQRSRRLRSTRAAAPVLLAHDVARNLAHGCRCELLCVSLCRNT